MSPASLAARLLRRAATTSSSPFSPLARRGLNSSAPVPLPRRLPAATSSSAGTTARRFLASQSPASSSFKSSADENLRRVIESEIECVVQSEESTADKHIDLPNDFPFEIIDNPGDQTITLQREIAGETIKAAIYTNFDTEEDLDDEDDKSDKDEESFKPAIQMVVSIQKPEGPILEFDCNFNDDELAIENMRVLNRDNPAENVYEGPRFPVLDESLQKALHRYLEVRGFKHSLHDWLYEYMMRKDEKEYVVWLKNMKEFMGGN